MRTAIPEPSASFRSARAMAVALAGINLLCSAAAQIAPTVQAPSSGTHTVQPGDTLWDLSRRYLHAPIRWPEIQKDNEVRIPERLRPGQVLTLGNSATVIELSGDVMRQRSNATLPVSIGAALQADDVLITGRQGFVTVELSDGSRVVVPSSSAVRLISVSGRATRLQVLDGRIESYVEKRRERDFEIRTRTFALGVKGTHFRVASDAGGDRLEVLEGSVLATSLSAPENRALLAAGTGAALDASSLTTPRALLAPPEQRPVAPPGTVQADPVPGASDYRLQLARDPDFLQLVSEDRSARPSFPVAPTLVAGFYHARLSALDASGVEGRPSPGIVFASQGQPPPLSATRRMADGRYEIRWTLRQSPRHTFELARTPDFSAPLAEVEGYYPAGVTIGPIEEPGRYFWRCREPASDTSAPCSGSFEVSSLERGEVSPR